MRLRIRTVTRSCAFLQIIGVVVAAVPATAWAYGHAESGGNEQAISVGAGIAAPGATSAYAENPAGLVFNSGPKLELEADSGNSNLNPLGLGALGFFGNGSAGAVLGVQTSNAFGASGGNVTFLDYGLAATLGSSDVSIGLAGTYALYSSGYGNTINASPWGINAGALFNAHGMLRVGTMIYDLTNGVGGFGAGVAYDLSPDATAVADAASDKSLNGKTLKPGLQVRLNPIELAVSYGFGIDDSGASPISRGTTLGLGVRLSESLHLIAYYNELATYYLGLTIHF